jgi:hypothetical protein
MHPKQDLPNTPVIHVDAGCLMTAVGQFRSFITLGRLDGPTNPIHWGPTRRQSELRKSFSSGLFSFFRYAAVVSPLGFGSKASKAVFNGVPIVAR